MQCATQLTNNCKRSVNIKERDTGRIKIYKSILNIQPQYVSSSTQNIGFYKLTNMLFTKSIILEYEMLLYLHCILTMTFSNDKLNVALFASILYTGKHQFSLFLFLLPHTKILLESKCKNTSYPELVVRELSFMFYVARMLLAQ